MRRRALAGALALVCGDCGYSAFFAQEPAKFAASFRQFQREQQERGT